MLTRIIVGLAVLAALVEGLFPEAVPENILPLVLVILGLVHGAMNIDAEDNTNMLVVVIAAGGAAAADVLTNIHVIGDYLDAILDALMLAVWSIVVSVLVRRIWNRLMGDDGSSSASEAE